MILRLVSPQPRSKKWTEKENLGINASPNLKLNCTLLIALSTVFDKGSIDLKIRVEVASHESVDLHGQLIDMEEEFTAKQSVRNFSISEER